MELDDGPMVDAGEVGDEYFVMGPVNQSALCPTAYGFGQLHKHSSLRSSVCAYLFLPKI